MKLSARLIISCRDLNSTLFFSVNGKRDRPIVALFTKRRHCHRVSLSIFSMLSSSKGLGDFHRIR